LNYEAGLWYVNRINLGDADLGKGDAKITTKAQSLTTKGTIGVLFGHRGRKQVPGFLKVFNRS